MGRKLIFFRDVSKQTGQNSEKPASNRGRNSIKGAVHIGVTAGFYGADKGESLLSVGGEIHQATERIKAGDLSDVERILTEQLYLMHAATAVNANWHNQAKILPARDASLKAMIQCSRATRQIAVAIANIKNPKRFTVIEKQQNVMVNRAETPGPDQLGESTNAPMDTGSHGTTAPVDTAAETLGA